MSRYVIRLEVVPREGNSIDDIRQLITDLLADKAKEFEVGFAQLILSPRKKKTEGN